jgi:mono/diheme cytochrome c family protein
LSSDGRVPARRFRRVGLAILGLVTALSGCTDAAGYDLDYILAWPRFISTMRSTVAYPPQTLPRHPAEGSVPVASPLGDVLPPFTQGELETVAAALANPLPATPEILARGAVVYRNQCFACHGAQGEGNGPVIGGGRFPLGPAVNDAVAAGRSDGYLYGVVRVGRGLMPAYAERITHQDRWAVVHYMRQLQQQAGAAPPPAAVAAPIEPQPDTPAAPIELQPAAPAPPQ